MNKKRVILSIFMLSLSAIVYFSYSPSNGVDFKGGKTYIIGSKPIQNENANALIESLGEEEYSRLKQEVDSLTLKSSNKIGATIKDRIIDEKE